ncbi:MAG TPA: L-aspartate oxidase [Candidatus Brocadiia bacterium]|nr:L-aspartate oxidase [Candidatus Brocadiia bacterium]
MKRPIDPRRYLVQFSSHNLPHIFTDVLIIGGGIAGLSAALEAAKSVKVTVVCKEGARDCNTWHAQGGIAAAIAPWDSPEKHFEDTISAGQQLADPEIVKLVVERGAERIREMIKEGFAFDRDNGELAFGQEGGHGQRRILHADGDSTGSAVLKFLLACVKDNPNIQMLTNVFTIDLLDVQKRCDGVVAYHPDRGVFLVRAKQTILAAGGCGRIFRETTNSPVATGDGPAMAWRAGVELMDMEFMQFHPTTLYVAGATRALISEAVRGEGGLLVNSRGERFMPNYHESAELAPRDAVSRAIVEELARTKGTCVYVDVRHIPAKQFKARFPLITRLCAGFGIDPAHDLIPVRPAAHYMIGGVKVGQDARTSMPGLFACGEVACTGLHGANRLGSNSLLEGLVFGGIAGREAAAAVSTEKEEMFLHSVQGILGEPKYGQLDLEDVGAALRSLMWRDVGVVRDQKNLDDAEEMINFWCRYVMDKIFDSPEGWALQNMLTTSKLIAMCARQREETRGVHFRADFPETKSEWHRHIVVRNSGRGWL